MGESLGLKLRLITLMIVAIVLIIIPTAFSMYKSNTNANGTLVLAEWDVSLNQTGVNNSLTVVSGGANDTYTLNIRSLAEVDVKYTIVISNLPAGVEVALDNGSFQSQVSNTITFTNVGTILYTDVNKTKSHLLTFKAVSGTTAVNAQAVNINVIVEQIL